MEQRNLKSRNDMFQQKNKRAKLGEGGREREESSMLVRTFLCLSFCSLVTDALSLLETILECCCSCLPKPKKLTDTTSLLPNRDTVRADRGRRKGWSYVEITLQEHAHAVGSSREAAAARNNPPLFLSFFLPPFFSSLINTYAAQQQDKKPAAQLLLHHHPSFCS
jgi:hypothetical protein